MLSKHRHGLLTWGVAVLVTLITAQALTAQPIAVERLGASRLTVEPLLLFDQAVLRVSGPQGYWIRKTFEAGASITVDLFADRGPSAESDGEDINDRALAVREGLGLPDGRYRYEVVFLPGREVFTGLFFVEGGLPASRGAVRQHLGEVRGELLSARAKEVEAGGRTPPQAYENDYVIVLDQANDGYTFIELDSYNNPPDDSDWYMVNGSGDLLFFEKPAGVPGAYRMAIEAGGEVGIGTVAPADALHITSDPDIRLEGGGSTWQFDGGDDLNFTLIDDGTGTPPFAGQVLTLEDDENAPSSIVGVGIFETNPVARLHVSSPKDDGTAKILVEEENPTTAGRTLFELRNNGNVQFFFQNTNSGDIFQMSLLSTVFQVSTPTGQGKFRVKKNGGLAALTGSTVIMDLDAAGNVNFAGTISQPSSREVKRDLAAIDGREVLDKVVELPIAEWSYKKDNPEIRHLGPMAEDFHALFGLGKDEKGITSIDSSGVALAAIQGLNQKSEEKDARIAKLSEQNAELEARLRQLEEVVQALTARSDSFVREGPPAP